VKAGPLVTIPAQRPGPVVITIPHDEAIETRPLTVAAYKVVQVVNGRFQSLVALGSGGMPRIYNIGETLRETAVPHHGGGLFAYALQPGAVAQLFAQGRIAHGVNAGSYAILQVETRGPFVAYDAAGNCLGYIEDPRGGNGKYAASEMKVLGCAARFQIEGVTHGYYAYERRTKLKMVTKEIYGQPCYQEAWLD